MSWSEALSFVRKRVVKHTCRLKLSLWYSRVIARGIVYIAGVLTVFYYRDYHMDANYYKKYEPLFGAWYITKQIGEGSYGRVYIIERHELGQTYRSALKAITVPGSQDEIKSAMSDGMTREDVTGYYKNVANNIISEFILMSKLKGNSHIVSYEDHIIIEHEDDIGWDILIRMELLTPLVELTAQSQMNETEVIKLGVDLCKALELCRRYDIIHRDIKPENIFISANGDYKIGDFGVAKTIEKTKMGLSRKGTYLYMAPEIYSSRPYGPTVDIYSLGIVMYKLLNENRLPFLPEYPKPIAPVDKEEALHKRLKGTDISEPKNGSRRLKQIVLKACAYKPEDRYGRAEEMRRDLEHLLYGITDSEDSDADILLKPKRKSKVRKKAAAIICAAALVAGIAAAALIPGEITDITGINDSEEIYIDETLSPDYQIKPARFADEKLLFESGDNDIFTVDQNGSITANEPGSSTLEISAGDYSRQISVTVVPKITEITGVSDNIRLEAGSSRSLSPKLSPEKFADEQISYSIKDKSVATVSSKGKIKGKKSGRTKLTISAGGCSRVITVAVYNKVSKSKTETGGTDTHVPNPAAGGSNNNSSNGYFSNGDDEYF